NLRIILAYGLSRVRLFIRFFCRTPLMYRFWMLIITYYAVATACSQTVGPGTGKQLLSLNCKADIAADIQTTPSRYMQRQWPYGPPGPSLPVVDVAASTVIAAQYADISRIETAIQQCGHDEVQRRQL